MMSCKRIFISAIYGRWSVMVGLPKSFFRPKGAVDIFRDFSVLALHRVQADEYIGNPSFSPSDSFIDDSMLVS